ncbi:hypothetical protein CM19_01225 [Candidatus Acidianus copahuensis]|uniref:Probable transposase IS891/IS1136/IS1341 domain-containing protein n=1 Tax=Candidatus Acidianus copahuensis TaxID=1160895 RepID=A0A031LSS0_9CREN|nr:transposase [Candidatus Acidianus copahuensis]EZQ11427.1 hypothetical protein CM19_01225 [Candidatus Acidianus copahuensis]
MHIKGKQGRLEIIKDGDSWYAHISFEVEEKAVRKEWRKIPLSPKGNLNAGIDIGINNLLAIYTEDGKAKLFNGRPLKTIAFYYKYRLARYQSILNKYGVKTSKKLRVLVQVVVTQ